MGRMLLVLAMLVAVTFGLAIVAEATESGGPSGNCLPTSGVTDANKDIRFGSCLFKSTTAFGQRNPNGLFSSCAACHPDNRTDQVVHAVQVVDVQGTVRTVMRRAPNLRNVSYNVPLGWDGRFGGTPGDAASLRIAVILASLSAILSPVEMQGTFESLTLAKLEALAAFVISRSPAVPTEIPEPPEFSQETLQRVAVGRAVFFGKGQCAGCHPPPFFTDHQIRTNVGTGAAQFDFSGDPGAGAVGTGRFGEFKTPSLHHFYPEGRPFMHNGALGQNDSQLFRFYQKSLGFTLTGEEQTGLHYWLQNCPRGAGKHPLALPATC